ncbi:ABC transporter transmembrane region domain-containing protein [Toxoplasma gondii MAS]|uniref:ABC transporter transmembrane region domain-containing protein n=2 Tax=Toxoplasma gondii TaxID=5811 RepID=A0A086Q3H2_TOXGO|nr:ABC transporter transmembrane region domain-containing protein [Toxoplasma gondii MAS]PUA86002.1 ABC transporter transmembrane region domain-containing protein [Toxoplasma gondii TgCATBr9]
MRDGYTEDGSLRGGWRQRSREKKVPLTFDSAGVFGKLFFTWINPVISTCMQHSVRPEELPPLSASDDVSYWSERTDKSLAEEEKLAAEGKRKPSVIRALWRVFRGMLLWIFVVYVIRDALGVLNTYFLKRLLQLDVTDASGFHRTVVIGSLISLVQLLQIFIETSIDFYTCRVYMRVEMCLLTSLFKKVIQPDTAAPPALIFREARPEETACAGAQKAGEKAEKGLVCVGEKAEKSPEEKKQARGFQGNVFNLMFVDIPSLASLIFTFVDVVMMPVRIGFAAGMLYMQIGVAAEVPGLIIVLAITAVTTILEVINASMKTKYMLYRDVRLDKSHEALSSMRTVRLLGWEDIAECNIKRYRDLEMHQRTLRMYLSAVSTWLSSSAATAMSIATFMAYTLPFIHKPRFRLRPELAIPVIHLLDSFIGPITDFPYAVNSVIEGYISLARIQNCFFPPVSSDCSPAGKKCDKAAKRPAAPGVSTPRRPDAEAGEDSPLLAPATEGVTNGFSRKSAFCLSSRVYQAAAEMLHVLQTDPSVEVIFSSATFAWMPHASSPFSPPPPFPRSLHLPLPDSPAERPEGAHASPLLLLPPAAAACGVRTLHDWSLQLRRGDLLLLTGPPGCGKSSVFHALLQQRELQLVEGAMFVKAALAVSLHAPRGQAGPSTTTDDTPPIGYIAQEPWLQIGTIKENIVFNQTVDETLYRRVVTACELHLDFDSWPGGDSRFIDEGGADLSGGQRMRIAMARAIYVSLAYRAQAQAQAACVAPQLTQRRQELLSDLRRIVGDGEAAQGGRQTQEGTEKQEGEGARKESEQQEGEGREMHAEEISHLLCFDETFNSLDPYVASRIFSNLFGPGGLLVDAAVIVGASEQSLSGLVDQLKGDRTPPHSAADSDKKMNISVGCLEDGRLAWLGTPEAFWTRVHEGTPAEASGVSTAAQAQDVVEEARNAAHATDAAHASPVDEKRRLRERAPRSEETIDGVLRGLELETPGVCQAEESSGLDDMLKNLMVNEQAASGQVKLVSYGWYLRRLGLLVAGLLVLLHLLTSGTDFASDLWIAKWTGKRPSSRAPDANKAGPPEHAVEGPGSVRGEEKKIAEAENQAARSLYDNQAALDKKQVLEKPSGTSNAFYLWCYVAIAGANIVFELLVKLTSARGSLTSASYIHSRLLNVVCTAPLWFYDQNPIGRILNRLSTDIAVIDAGIFKRMSLVLGAFLSCGLGLAVLAWTTTWALPLIPVLLLGVYFLVFRYYRATCREVQRASLISFSPLCSSFSECLSGRDTIFALRRKRDFCAKNLDQVEKSQRAKILHWGSSSWASIRLQLLTFPLAVLNAIVPRAVAYAQLQNAVATAAASGAVATVAASGSVSHAGYLGLALSYSLSVASSLRRLLIHYAHLEKEMCSVERVHEYISCTDKLNPDSVAVMDDAARLPSDQAGGPPPGVSHARRASDRASVASQSGSAFPFLPVQRLGLQLVGVEVRYRRPGFHYVPRLRELLQARLAAEERGERIACETEEDAVIAPFLRGDPTTEQKRERHIRWLQKAVKDLERGDESIFLAPSVFRLSAQVGPTQHVGIIGRTGSGKSTLLQALNGLVPCYRGAILLDGTRIDCLPKQVLKQVIGVLPQNPITFKGMTVRDVLDPRHQFTDAELWAALDEVGISSLIQCLPGGMQLDTVVSPDDSVPPECAGACGQAKSRSRLFPQGSERRRSSIRSTASFHEGETWDPGARGDAQDVVSSHPLSDVQVRYLAVARLALRAGSYRLILVDEPPAETLDQLHAGDDENEESPSDSASAGENGEHPVATLRRQSTCSHAPFVPIPQLIRRVFAHCTVFIVAHHAASLMTCDTVWLMWKGRKIGECSPAEIRTDKQLGEVMMRQVNEWKRQCADQ